MTRPITVVYQELAVQTPAAVEPDLNTLIIAPAYQILDYEDDRALLRVADYGEAEGDMAYAAPTANIPAIVIAAPPELVAGGWVDPASVRIHFEDAQVLLVTGTDGSVTAASNVLTSAGATFIADGIAAGDMLVIEDPANPANPPLRLAVRSILTETTLMVPTNFLTTTASLDYRIERTIASYQVDADFITPPTFGTTNEITLLGGVTYDIANVPYVVQFGEVYVSYRAFRTDIQEIQTISAGSATTDIETLIGKIDARNPLGALAATASQNAGQAPIYVYGVESDDLLGYMSARDAISSDKDTYAIVLGTASLAILAMFKTDNVTLADPTAALANGIPQKFRMAIGAVELETTIDVVEEVALGTSEVPSSPAVPPGIRTATFAALDLTGNDVRPGDRLVITNSSSTPSLDGSYLISHINSQFSCEVDTAFPATVAAPAGVNVSVVRPSTGATLVADVDNCASMVRSGVTITALRAGVTAGAITVALTQSGATPGGINQIVEVANTSIVVHADFDLGLTITTAELVAAINEGTGVTVPFAGSVNVSAVETTPGTVSTAIAAALSTGTAGVNSLTSTAVLDSVYIQLFDAAATFISDGVEPGDILEIPTSPNGAFTTGIKRYVVDQVLSEQRLTITNTSEGSYTNNSSTTEVELPHLDNRLGTGTAVSQGTIRYRVTRELTKDQQVDTLVSMAQSLRSQRAIMVWPDLVEVEGLVDGSKPRLSGNVKDVADPQPGTFLAAAVGGMTAGLPNHQGFSRIGIAGIGRVYHSQKYFTESQLTRISEGGIYVFVQDTPQSLPYTIHQLTTDPSALQTGEYSMVKNFDYLSRFFVGILDPFIGIWNVNEETLGFMRQAVNSGVAQLKLRRVARIGAPLNDAAVVSLAVSDASPDRVELYMNVDRPVPLNVIGLHLIG